MNAKDILITANIPEEFAKAVKKLHQKHNCELIEYKSYKNNWITVTVKGVKEDIEKLNKECENIAYGEIDNL